MYPLPAPIITCKSSRLLSEMVHDAAVMLMLKAIRAYMVTAITPIMIVTSWLAGMYHSPVLNAKHCSDFMHACLLKVFIDNSCTFFVFVCIFH